MPAFRTGFGVGNNLPIEMDAALEHLSVTKSLITSVTNYDFEPLSL